MIIDVCPKLTILPFRDTFYQRVDYPVFLLTMIMSLPAGRLKSQVSCFLKYLNTFAFKY